MSTQDGTVETFRFHERFTTCASCRAEARWMVNGTTSCDRHLALWQRRAAAQNSTDPRTA